MSDVQLSGVVMAHPNRAVPGRALIRSLRPGLFDLVLDPVPDGPPTTLRTATLAWSSISATATHHVVLEDDAEPVPGFVEHAERAAAAMPHAAIAFHSNWSSRNGGAARLGVLAGARWAVATQEYTPAVGLMLPAPVAAGFAAYVARHGDGWPADVVMARYLKSIGVTTYLTVPNLVEHGDLPSLTDNDQHGSRRSACFAPLAADADWSPRLVLEPDVVPFFKFGMEHCAFRDSPGGRWRTLGFERSTRRLGIDIEACRDAFRSALARLPDAVRGLGELAPPVVESLWRAAYLTGWVGRRPERFPDPADALAAWSADPWVDVALTAMGQGGICMSLPARRLVALGDHLNAVARAGLVAGAAHSGRATPAAVTAPRRRVVVIAAKGQTLGRYVAADLADRGYHTEMVDLDGAGPLGEELDPALRGADAVVYAGSGAPDEALARLVAVARSTGVAHFVHLDPPGAPCPASTTADDLATTTLRLGVPYGPEVDSTPLNDLVARSLVKRSLVVRAGQDRLRFAHVWDIGEAVDRVLVAASPGRTWDICGEEYVTASELAEVVTRVVKPVPVEAAPDAPGGWPAGRDLTPDAARSGLGWTPVMPLAEGIRTVSQWLAYEVD
ncbi:hypothetical protein ABGB07_40835 [Micromonosporaceae bacterium B7E4]